MRPVSVAGISSASLGLVALPQRERSHRDHSSSELPGGRPELSRHHDDDGGKMVENNTQ